jgi:hypothetical protein
MCATSGLFLPGPASRNLLVSGRPSMAVFKTAATNAFLSVFLQDLVNPVRGAEFLIEFLGR